MRDVEVIFHHPALRDERVEIHRNMYRAVEKWAHERPDRGRSLDQILSSASVKAGKNHKAGVSDHAMVDHHKMSSQQMNAAASGSHASGGLLDSVTGLLGGSGSGGGHNNSSSYFGGAGSGQHSGSSPLGMVGNLYNTISGSGGHGQQQHHKPSGGGGGLNDMLHMAEKLPIPGMHNMTSTLNKFGLGGGGGGHSSGGLGSFLGGGRRGLDDEPGVRGLPEDDPARSEVLSGGYGGIGQESQLPARERSPSPGPLAPPSGYERYTASGLDYDGGSSQSAPPYTGGNEGYYASGYGQQNQSQGYEQSSSGYGQQQQYGGYQQQQQGGQYGGASGDYYR
jgi:hypothetical protein